VSDEASSGSPGSSGNGPSGNAPKKLPLVVWLVAAIALGILAGVLLGARAAILGELGALVIKLLKALATPLVFFAVVDSFCRAEMPARKGALLLCICALNAAVAGAIAIGLSAVLAPGAHTRLASSPAGAVPAGAVPAGAVPAGAVPAAPPQLDPLTAVKDLIPESVPEPFLRNNVLAIVLLAVICGVALRSMRARGKGARLLELVEEVFGLLTTVLHYVIALVPLAVFGVVAKVVGTTGFGIFVSLGALVGTVSLGLAIHVFGYYTLLLLVVARRSPARFFRAAGNALATAFGTGSSMATLPVTLRTLEGELGVTHGSARLAACVGTNFNNDGIMLYEVVAALFVAQISGIALGMTDKIQLALTSALAAAGIAGVPEAGLITLSLVLASVGLPLSSLPVLLTVDWFLGRLRAMTNVTADMMVATLLARIGGRAGEEPGEEPET
jgi:DAACS family dicarboxylate/amino acid:cation (Na+ or H+) symporter